MSNLGKWTARKFVDPGKKWTARKFVALPQPSNCTTVLYIVPAAAAAACGTDDTQYCTVNSRYYLLKKFLVQLHHPASYIRRDEFMLSTIRILAFKALQESFCAKVFD